MRSSLPETTHQSLLHLGMRFCSRMKGSWSVWLRPTVLVGACMLIHVEAVVTSLRVEVDVILGAEKFDI